jgi:hypothetical protein
MAGKNALYPIPHPAKRPFVGNILSIGSDSPVLDMWKIAQDLGAIYCSTAGHAGDRGVVGRAGRRARFMYKI